MRIDYSAHFRELVEAQLPDDARILLPRSGADLMILMTWRLHSDRLRPHKRSRLVRIVIQQEALMVYAAEPWVVRKAWDARFVSWLWAQLGAFDPNHEAPVGVEPPAVTWTVGRAELGG